MEKKYVLTEDIRFVDGRTLYRIRAEENFSDVRKGDLGGFVEKEENLSQLGDSWIYDEACVYDNARIYDDARVFGDACVCGNANIFENARVCGDACVYGEARIGEHTKVQFSRLNTDLKEDLKASLRCQCNLISEDGKVIAYKLVRKDLRSLHDINFIYKIGEYAVCENPKEDNSSCSAGLHFSNLTYWDNKCGERFNNLVYLKAEIDLQDIITIQEGKIRCRKAKILSKIEIE